MPSQELKRISKRAQDLLNGQEDETVDFKQSPGGLDAEDLVAFANAPTGGTILLGVTEAKQSDGRQRGEVIGCPVGDVERLTIINKAESCIPPVDVNVIIENIDAIPFFRIEIPSGTQKPYCTSRGTYKIRGDGANKPLTPRRLLALFLESESEEFLQRFRDATEELDAQLAKLLSTMNTLVAMSHTLNSALQGENGALNGAADITAIAQKLDRILAHMPDEAPEDHGD